LLLSAYNYKIIYKPTDAHANADGLSRLPLAREYTDFQETSIFNICQIESLPVTSQQLKAVTRTDPVLSKVLLYSKNGWPVTVPELLKPYWKRRLEISIEDECLMWDMVPHKLRKAVLKELHQSHFGVVCMKAAARSYMW